MTFGSEPLFVNVGGATALQWQTVDATSCMASGAWSGARPTSGSETTGALNATTEFTLTCNGPGGSTSRTVRIAANQLPVADAGPDRAVLPGVRVALRGTHSRDAEGPILTQRWQQVAGPEVVLVDSAAAITSFVAPTVDRPTALVLQLVVTDGFGADSAPDEVTITVLPVTATASVSGVVRHQRVPATSTVVFSDFARQAFEPSRGLRLEVIAAQSQTIVATASTDASGAYSVEVPPNEPLFIRVHASMEQDHSLPRWRFEVRDVPGAGDPYWFDGDVFVADVAGTPADVSIPSGWSASGEVIGPQASGAFTILDSIYLGYTTVLAVAPAAEFPPLDLDWNAAAPRGGGSTFYARAPTRMISLRGTLAIDLHEFDPDVVLHEFGHYLQEALARNDSRGGEHFSEVFLDPRNAFSEGFATAFSVIARDITGTTHMGTQRDLETGAARGWYSEVAVGELLWDLYDAANETDDAVALGWQPLWNALVEQRSTPALTTIFSFVATLKRQRADVSADIDTLTYPYGIQPVNDEFGSTETNDAGSPGVLPVYSPIILGGAPVTVRSSVDFRIESNSAGPSNKLGIHRFLRFDLEQPQTVRLSLASALGKRSMAFVYRQGRLVGSADSAQGAIAFPLREAGTHVIDVWDCDNGGACGSSSGRTAATTDIRVQLTSP
ncbi:PKD domain-containing protein [Steroidobacter cummioxidans]|uniref:PKD domain-containing protein n=1 Tax=Steroidobacter cummioxidans TaxID=1803913 RepID=UPI000E314CA8|nr:hypothetical protein [Steroidobacter cummioxidans]